jgi:hypothetical protein
MMGLRWFHLCSLTIYWVGTIVSWRKTSQQRAHSVCTNVYGLWFENWLDFVAYVRWLVMGMLVCCLHISDFAAATGSASSVEFLPVETKENDRRIELGPHSLPSVRHVFQKPMIPRCWNILCLSHFVRVRGPESPFRFSPTPSFDASTQVAA